MKIAFALVPFVAALSAARADVPARLDGALKEFLQGYAKSPVFPGDPTLRASVATVDLRGDGAKETLVYLNGRDWCGTGGCSLLVLRRDGPSFKIISKTSITRLPISILPTRSHGWSNLGVTVAGGGITKAYVARLPFDGSGYARNPTMPPASRAREPHGTVAISADDPGEPLFP